MVEFWWWLVYGDGLGREELFGCSEFCRGAAAVEVVDEEEEREGEEKEGRDRYYARWKVGVLVAVDGDASAPWAVWRVVVVGSFCVGEVGGHGGGEGVDWLWREKESGGRSGGSSPLGGRIY